MLCFWSPALDPDGPTLPSHHCQQMSPSWCWDPPSQEHVPPEERVIHPPQPCLPGFCLSWYKSTGGRVLCTHCETHSQSCCRLRGAPKAQHHQMLLSKSPSACLFLWQVKSCSVPYELWGTSATFAGAEV